jgi:hypothetical protein
MAETTIKAYMHASFETAGFRIGADEAIETFCSLVENFPEDVREVWDNCCTRIFDIGYESRLSSTSFRSEIRESTVQRMGKIKASIRITIYTGNKEGDAGD